MRPVLALLALLVVGVGLVVWLQPTRARGAAPEREPRPPERAEPSAADVLVAARALAAGPPAAVREPQAVEDPAELVISGVVEVDGGLPAGEIEVVGRVHRSGVSRRDSPRIEAGVARDGRFGLVVPAGTRSVGLDLEARLLYLDQEVEVPPGAHGVVLRPRVLALVRGRVHRPLGFRHHEQPIHVSFGAASQVYADSDGAFELVVQPGREDVLVARAGMEATPATPQEAQSTLPALHPGEERWVELALEPWRTVRGIVTDVAGVPLAGASLELAVWSHQSQVRGFGPWSAGVDGRFELGPLAPGSSEIRVSAEGMCSTLHSFELPADADRWHVLALSPVTRVVGRVLTPDGQPCPGARVKLEEETRDGQVRLLKPFLGGAGRPELEQGIADASGRFELLVTREGARLVATAPGYVESLPFEPGPGSEVRDVELRLRPSCTLSVRLLDADGRPVVALVVLHPSGGRPRYLRTDAQGELEASDLPAGTTRVGAVAMDGATFALLDDPSAAVEVELSPDLPARVELRLAGR